MIDINQPFLSIILPTYNRKHCISRMIDSILMQNFKDFELIIIDDGSTDGTKEMLETKYSDRRMRIVCKENGGVSTARNLGISLAQGEYLTFVDSDDYLLDGFFEDIYQSLKHNRNIDLVIFPMYIQNQCKITKSNIFFSKNAIYNVKYSEGMGVSSNVFLKDFCLFFGNPNVCSKIFRRDVIKNITFQENMHFGEDLLFTILAISKSNLVLPRTDERYYIYDIGDLSLSRGKLKVEKQISDLIDGFYFLHTDRLSLSFQGFVAFNYIKHLRFYIPQANKNFLKKNKQRINNIFKIANTINIASKSDKLEFLLLYAGLKFPFFYKLLNRCYGNSLFFSMLKFLPSMLKLKGKQLWLQFKKKIRLKGGGVAKPLSSLLSFSHIIKNPLLKSV